MFGLSSAETHLVELMAEGLSAAECTQRRGVSLATVRSQIAGIFAKTGVKTQAQLMRLVLAAPPLR